MKKRWIAMLLTLALCSSLLINAHAETITFSDVPANYWGYDTIMKMTEKGLFKGTTEPVNGVGTFAPEKTMTRAEFVTAVLRAVYPEQVSEVQNVAGKWWLGYYHLALKYGLLYVDELNNGAMDQPISRQEMAMVLVRAVKVRGETLSALVEESQIADFASISSTYRIYVRECFSMGLIAGIDTKGTFAPVKSLTRAEAATVLCRLIYEDERVEVEEDDATDKQTSTGIHKPSGGHLSVGNNNNSNQDSGNSAGQGSGNTQSGTMIPNNPETNAPTEEEQSPLPWEDGGKQPSQYTWEEFMNLDGREKEAFIDSFGSSAEYERWLTKVQGDASFEDYPWENGGKQPSQYTWEEFMNLDGREKEAFIDSFGSSVEYERWLTKVQGGAGSEDYPWDNGGKKPSNYTLDEFNSLSEGEKEAFFEWFASPEAFETWMEKAIEAEADESIYPWDNGEKLPSAYTWEEFEALPGALQEAFFEWFDTPQAFQNWMDNAQ